MRRLKLYNIYYEEKFFTDVHLWHFCPILVLQEMRFLLIVDFIEYLGESILKKNFLQVHHL